MTKAFKKSTILLHVDDGLVIADNKDTLLQLVKQLDQSFGKHICNHRSGFAMNKFKFSTLYELSSEH